MPPVITRARSSAAERSAHNRLVVGSNPTEPTSDSQCFIKIAGFYEKPLDLTDTKELLQLCELLFILLDNNICTDTIRFVRKEVLEMRRRYIISLIGLLILVLLLIAIGCQKLPTQSPEKTAPSLSEEPSTTSQETATSSTEQTSEPSEPEIVEPFVHSSAYIKFEGIDGESQSKGHEGWSEIVSFSQQIVKPSGGTTDITRRRGDVVIEDIIIVKAIDKASPKLAEAICKGVVYPTVEIHLTGPSEVSTCEGTFYVYLLENVMITSYKVTGSNPLANALIAPAPDSILPYSGPFIVQAVDAPMEEIALNFEEITVTYTECDSTGKSKGNIEFNWRIEEAESY